jgi:hypothetical protein
VISSVGGCVDKVVFCEGAEMRGLELQHGIAAVEELQGPKDRVAWVDAARTLDGLELPGDSSVERSKRCRELAEAFQCRPPSSVRKRMDVCSGQVAAHGKVVVSMSHPMIVETNSVPSTAQAPEQMPTPGAVTLNGRLCAGTRAKSRCTARKAAVAATATITAIKMAAREARPPL